MLAQNLVYELALGFQIKHCYQESVKYNFLFLLVQSNQNVYQLDLHFSSSYPKFLVFFKFGEGIYTTGSVRLLSVWYNSIIVCLYPFYPVIVSYAYVYLYVVLEQDIMGNRLVKRGV